MPSTHPLATFVQIMTAADAPQTERPTRRRRRPSHRWALRLLPPADQDQRRSSRRTARARAVRLPSGG